MTALELGLTLLLCCVVEEVGDFGSSGQLHRVKGEIVSPAYASTQTQSGHPLDTGVVTRSPVQDTSVCGGGV